MTGAAFIPSLPFVESQNKNLIAKLRAFSDDDWRRPSYCPGWTASHVIGHMTLGARFYAHTILAAREGKESLPFGAKDIPDFRERRTSMMEELAALSGGERTGRFEEAVNDLQEVFGAIRPEDLDTLAWHPRCPTPVRHFPQQRFYELILHGWDIRNEPDSPLAAEGLEHGTEILKDRLPFWYGDKPDPDLEGFFRLETTGPDHAWGVDIRNRAATLCAADEKSADATIKASASDMILMACGRADTGAKRERGALAVEGDTAKAEVFINILFRSF